MDLHPAQTEKEATSARRFKGEELTVRGPNATKTSPPSVHGKGGGQTPLNRKRERGGEKGKRRIEGKTAYDG